MLDRKATPVPVPKSQLNHKLVGTVSTSLLRSVRSADDRHLPGGHGTKDLGREPLSPKVSSRLPWGTPSAWSGTLCAEVKRVPESDTEERPKYWVDAERSENHRAQLDLIPPSSRVLEIGAGPGHMTRALARRGCTVTAVERDEALAASARHACERLIVADVESQDFEDQLGEDRFDIVLLGDVLEHLKAPEEFLGRLRCRLTAGGCLVVCLPNVAHGALRLSLLEGRFEYRAEGLLDRTHLRLFTLSSLHETFRAAGYTVSDLRRIRRGLFETEIALEPASIPADALSFVCRDPEAATYQFVFRARPEGLAGSGHTDTVALAGARPEPFSATGSAPFFE